MARQAKYQFNVNSLLHCVLTIWIGIFLNIDLTNIAALTLSVL